ncbi:MAG: type II toxin-antitoxin system ParD family antitoxin [Desulfuromonas sp.]
MPTRNVVLTESQAQLVENLVSSGRYQNASEVLREGLRMIQEREQETADRLQVLREAVAVGVTDIQKGRYTSLDDEVALRSHMAAITPEQSIDSP